MTKTYDWDNDKNEKLLAKRGLSFESIVAVIEQYGVLDDIENPSANFPHQRALVVAIEGYAIIVPYVTDGETKFLKRRSQTAAPRKYTLTCESHEKPEPRPRTV